MEGENRVNSLRYREEREGERRDKYTRVVGCLMPYRPRALTSAQLKLSSVKSMPTGVTWGIGKNANRL